MAIGDKGATLDGLKASHDNLDGKITDLKSDLNYNHTAEPGYVLRATDSGHGNEWAMVGTPTDAQAETAINNWLDEHPEATTTVQDNSLTEAKFSDALKIKTLKDYIVPEMFGAKGDGTTDDTESLRLALRESHNTGVKLLIPHGKIYVVSNYLNSYEGSPYDIKLNIIGEKPPKSCSYATFPYGGIKLMANVLLFKDATVNGSMTNVEIDGSARDNGNSIFSHCILRGTVINGCGFSQLEAFMLNSGAISVTDISCNKFLTVYYFEKTTKSHYSFTDSLLRCNYINGGVERNNNACFNFAGFNGSNVEGNFIDYYRTIYEPKSFSSQIGFNTCVSIGNQYQVFRYFTRFSSDNNITSQAGIVSIGDAFNWMDTTRLDKLSNFEPYTYTNNNNETIDIPPYIFGWTRQYDHIIIKDAIIENNISKNNLVYISNTKISYPTSACHFSCDMDAVDIGVININEPVLGREYSFYNYISFEERYRQAPIDVNVVVPVDTLPRWVLGWCNVFNGMKVLYNNRIYTARIIYNQDTSQWQAKWVDEFGNIAS